MRYRRISIAGATYFFTLVTERRRPLFLEPAAVALFLSAVETIRTRHPFEVDAYVVLPDHVHALWTLPEGDAKFSTRWRLIKEAFTRAYIKTHPAPDPSESRTEVVSPAMLACVDLIAAPAYVLDRAWTARSWNVRARHLFVGWLDGTADRNLLRFIFLEPNDPAIHRLVADLNEGSEAFKRYWHERVVLGREGGERTFDHPVKGLLRYEQVTFALAGHPDLKLTILIQSQRGVV